MWNQWEGKKISQGDCEQKNKVGIIMLLGFKLYAQARAVKIIQ